MKRLDGVNLKGIKMIKPIPKKLLQNSVEYEEYLSDTGEGSSFETGVSLTNVKIEEQKILTSGLAGIEVIGNAMLFYDLVNSKGLTVEPVNESKITFESKIYTIKNVDVLRAEKNTPHHYEILLK